MPGLTKRLDFSVPHVLRSEAEYDAAVAEIDALLELEPARGTPEYDRLELLSVLVEAYDEEHHRMGDAATPQAVLDFLLEERGMTRADLAPILGGRSRVSEFFAGKRRLSIAQIQKLRTILNVPADLLLERVETITARTEPAIEEGSMLYEVPGILRMTPEQRLQGVENVSDFLHRARRVSDGSGVPGATAPLDLKLLFTTLARHNVQFVLIGALGATLHGFPRDTRDADITPARDAANLQRLAAALRELDARVYTEKVPEGLPFDCSPRMLARADIWNLITKAGRLDLAFQPSGTGGFTDLAANAVRFEVYGAPLLAARLEDIIRSKEAAGRPKDRQDVEVMREMLKRRTAGEQPV